MSKPFPSPLDLWRFVFRFTSATILRDDLIAAGDREAMPAAVIVRQPNKGAASGVLTQVLDFYELDSQALWIIFSGGQLLAWPRRIFAE
ncbi:MAG: hypothetical protein KDA48_12940 [Amphiplicatus sp.]|nr:hypothetical protein [Amphiplicatus sp.]